MSESGDGGGGGGKKNKNKNKNKTMKKKGVDLLVSVSPPNSLTHAHETTGTIVFNTEAHMLPVLPPSLRRPQHTATASLPWTSGL